MIKRIKRCLIAVILLQSLVIIGIPAAHGYALLSMIEAVAVGMIVRGAIQFNAEYPLQPLILAGVLLSLAAKIFIIILLCLKNMQGRILSVVISLAILLLGFVLVFIQTLSYDSFLAIVMLGSSIPFLMYWGRSIYLIYIDHKY